MIHVATVHHRSEDWIGVQLGYLERHTREPYRVWGCLNDIAPEHGKRFHAVVESADGSPGNSFNAVASAICNQGDAEDLLVFLHGDSFPIADWVGPARKMLDGTPLAAVRRDENLEEPHPHNCFTVTMVGLWREIDGDWSGGPRWHNAAGQRITDVGTVLWQQLSERGIEWRPIKRSNRRNAHPVFFGVYAGIVYHHGAAFRRPLSHWDAAQAPPLRHVHLPARYLALRRMARRNARLSAQWFERLRADSEFHRELS